MQKDYSLNPNTCICKCSRHLRSTVDNSIIVGNKIICVTDSVSSVPNAILINLTSTVSINSDGKKIS